MSRIGTITIVFATLLLTATATSSSWQVGTRLTLVTSDGARIIGVGEVVDFDLRLTLANGYSGLAVLVVEGPAGTLETFDVVIEEGGTVLLGEGGDYIDLGEAAEDSGLAYRVLFEDGENAEADAAARKRPASISPGELAEFLESEERAAGEEQRDSDLEMLGSGAAGRVSSEAAGPGESEAGPGQDERDRDDRRPVDEGQPGGRPDGLPLDEPRFRGPQLDDPRFQRAPLDESRLSDAPRGGRRASDLRRQAGNGRPSGVGSELGHG